MARKLVYMVGDPANGQYAVEGGHRFRVYICDTPSDLAESCQEGDLSIVKNPNELYIGDSVEGWVKTNICEGRPVHSVVFFDNETTDPTALFGFGTWVRIGEIPSLDAWGWKRTA